MLKWARAVENVFHKRENPVVLYEKVLINESHNPEIACTHPWGWGGRNLITPSLGGDHEYYLGCALVRTALEDCLAGIITLKDVLSTCPSNSTIRYTIKRIQRTFPQLMYIFPLQFTFIIALNWNSFNSRMDK